MIEKVLSSHMQNTLQDEPEFTWIGWGEGAGWWRTLGGGIDAGEGRQQLVRMCEAAQQLIGGAAHLYARHVAQRLQHLPSRSFISYL